ncbi:UDP-glucuronosyltransferase [Aphelenchoides besseyi]|nr:UDP-glucuronosyltransferase [Aphelenchoides besseyi]KAI6211307.1 UDP-glucuronosyltransferase [Aphelenchoides besseyi]
MFRFLLIVLVAYKVTSLKVLVVTPNVSYSHLAFAGRFADLLVDKKHDVDFLIPLWNRFVLGNGTQKARVRRIELKNTNEIEADLKKLVMLGDVFAMEITSATRIQYGNIDSKSCEGILSNRRLLHKLKKADYDVALAEYFDPCSFALFHHLGIKSVHMISAVPLDEQTAVANAEPIDFSYVPSKLMVHLINELKDKVTRKFLGSRFPSTVDLLQNIDYFWLNTNEFVDTPRATSPRFKHVGGIAVKAPGRLSPELEKLMNSATGGVVLISFGSIVRTTEMPQRVQNVFIETFAHFPTITFIWKVTKVDANLTSLLPLNVKLVEWMDQTAILQHANTLAFVTHGGLNSINEAAMYGIPLIGILFFSDQHINIAAAIRRGFGRSLDRKQLNLKGLIEALSDVLHNPRYRENAANIRLMTVNSPIKSVDLFVQHVEFAARVKNVAKALRLPAASDQTFWSRFHLELLLVTFVISFIFVHFSIAIVSYFIRGLRNHRSLLNISSVKPIQKKVL